MPPKNEDALCEAILGLAALGSEQTEKLSEQGRRFIEDNFSIDICAERHTLCTSAWFNAIGRRS